MAIRRLLALAMVAALGFLLLWAVGASLPAVKAAVLDEVTLPPNPPGPNLGESHKVASRRVVQAGEVFSYTIRLRNHGPNDTVVEVTDALPPGLAYQPGSAEPAAEYNGPAATLRWDGVPVRAGAEARLTYRVSAGQVATPTLITNTAVISADGEPLRRHAWVLVDPAGPGPGPGPNLGESHKVASRRMVQAGEVFSYTIRLRNRGPNDTVVSVTDALPPGLAYQLGSAEPAAEYNGPAATLHWGGVPVRAGAEARLTYRVSAGQVATPTLITNTAVISAGGEPLRRHAWTYVMPEQPQPGPKLAGSRKLASQRALAAGEVLAYTIRLHNSGTAAAAADVSDRIPPELDYVAGSASSGALYDEATRTLSWAGVAVPVDADVDLSFQVTTTGVASPTAVINTAVITAASQVYSRHVSVRLVPAPLPPHVDLVPPWVHSLTIGEQDLLTSPTVTLHISATDNVGVVSMFLREWQWVALPRPRWQVVQESGWIPYQADLAWILGSKPGVHYVGVWVADAAGNHTHMGRRGLDFANLVQPGAALPPLGLAPYLVAYDAGINVAARLAPTEGAAELYAWYVAGPPELLGGPADEISFATEKAGVYLFAVRGEPGAIYDLTIEPAGGPRAPAPPGPGPATALAEMPSGEADEIMALFSASGLDPLDEAEAPASPYAVYLPLVLK